MNRKKYLQELAQDFGLPFEVAFEIAEMLGENEDYDALLTTLEDYLDEYDFEDE